MKLMGELISELEVKNEIEIIIEEFELEQVELEKRHIKNIRENTAMLLEITDTNTIFDYQYPPRKKFETHGGYKIAKRKGAKLNEVKVFNLYFRFYNQIINAESIALMYRPPTKNEEWLFLLPDHTKRRIEAESRLYKEVAREYTLFKQTMDPDYQSFLIENSEKLNVNERCAQSLMHEYGHALHWRMFDALDIREFDEVYIWFYENKYAHNVDKRYPDFKSLTPDDKIYVLKECLVEDYRISLNQETENDMFILPNVITFHGDFNNPNLLEEGVSIMKDMLKPALENKAKLRKLGFSSEIDTVKAIHEINNRARRTNWTPGTPSMTDEDHLEVIRQLESAHSHVAVTSEG